MTFIETIILGAVQGLTEFIPVSSSGHLVLLQNLMAGASDHSFLEFINIGTTLALIVFFRRKIVEIIRDVVVNKNIVLLRNILITSIPAGIVGYIASDFIATHPLFGSVVTVAITLFVVGVLMIVLERLPKASQVKHFEDLSPLRAFFIGLAQMVALIPGVSRSGSTIVAGRLLGMSAADAAEYSFLASLPIMLAVTAKLFVKQSDQHYFVEHLPMLIVGNIFAFIAGMLAIGFLLNYLAKHDLKVFGYYRVVLALVVVAVLLVQ